MNHPFEEKTLTREEIFKGKIIELFLEEVQLVNGVICSREIIRHPGGVGIIAITNAGNIILVDQFRKALNKGLLEIPAGKLEKGEEPILTAMREFEEETGYKASKWDPLFSFYTSPGFADEKIYLFRADELSLIENKKHADEDEFVDVIEVPIDEAWQMVSTGRIQDAKTIIALQHAYFNLQ